MPRFVDPEALGPAHDVERFDCGESALDRWLVRHARQAAAAGSARTFVVCERASAGVVGYHALSAASVTRSDGTTRAATGMRRHPLPAVLLARLAVDRRVQGHGVGAWLLRDAMLRTLSAAEAVGIRLLLVHAMDDRVRAFYVRHGFEASPTDPLNLQMLIKDIRAAVDAG